MLSLLEIIALLLALSAFFGWINHLFVRLPHTIGLLVMALVASLALIAFDWLVPASNMEETISAAVSEIDFSRTLMQGMLAFLLFAGSLHVDIHALADRKYAVGAMATFGVCLSTAIVGCGFWWLAGVFGVDMPLIWALVFGALISPTDPVAVLSLLKSVRVPESLEVKIAGESLFNDGVGVVLFAVLLALAAGEGGMDVAHAAEVFVVEAGGGGLLGLVAGAVIVRAIRAIDNYSIEILITLALVSALYAIALRFHMSGPIAVVIAGLFVGNRGAKTAMSEETRRYLFDFWTVIDEILNSVLFLLIGLEVLIVQIDASLGWLAVASVPLVLAARLIAVSVPIYLLSLRMDFTAGAIPVLTWGGLRGGISVALALSLPAVAAKPPILLATYVIVIFSIIVQGLTIQSVVEKTVIR